MNICLIRPPKIMKLASGTMNSAPPLGLAFVAASLKDKGHRITVIDAIGESPQQLNVFKNSIYTNGLSSAEILERIPSDTQVIGFSMMFTENWLSDRALLKYLGEKLPGIPFFAGGEHISALPELWLSQSPSLKVCVIGEGEETAVDLIEVLSKNEDLHAVNGIVYRDGAQIITTPRRTRVKELSDIPRPAWELFPLDNYNKHHLQWGVKRGISLPILATRGCPYVCTFCSSPLMWGTRYYMRSPKDVADEIETFQQLYGATNYDFYDLTAIIKKEWIIDFAKEILDRKLEITWQIPGGTRSEAIDREVAKYLYLSGCRNITYAPESGSKEILRAIKKKISMPKMLESMRYAHKEGLNVKVNIILGFPDEKHTNLWQTIWFLIKCSWVGVHDATPAIFSPYPGSALFTRLCEEGKINFDTDAYFWGILDSNDYLGGKFYNAHVSKRGMRVYFLLYLLFFFGSSYLFRPQRLVRTVRNLMRGKQESRGEAALADLLKRKTFKVNNQAVVELAGA